MSKISKISLLLAGISFICLLVARITLGGWHHVLWVPLALFLIMFSVVLFKDAHFFIDFFKMKTTKRGLSMGSLIVLMLGALTLVNIIAVRKYKTWDLSSARTNTLSEQSISLVKSLQQELKVLFFYKKGQEGTEENRRAFRELIKKYQDYTEKIKLEFVEVNERPDLANEYGVTKGSGLVFVSYNGRKNRIEKIDEQEFTSALVKVTREKERTVYFVEGHGELDIEEAKDSRGANALKLLFENNRYVIKTLALNTSPKVPADADLVILLGPQQTLFDHEIKALSEFLKQGGSLWVNFEDQKTAGLEVLLKEINVSPRKDLVFNLLETAVGKGINPSITVATEYALDHAATKIFNKSQAVVFQQPMSFDIQMPVDGVTTEFLVKTPENSVAYSDFSMKGDGRNGAAVIAISAKGQWPQANANSKDEEKQSKEFQLVAFGDSQFLSNSLLYQSMNRDLALNLAAAMVREENMVSITPREPGITEFKLSDDGFRFYILGFILPFPVLMMAMAIGLWMRRRFA